MLVKKRAVYFHAGTAFAYIGETTRTAFPQLEAEKNRKPPEIQRRIYEKLQRERKPHRSEKPAKWKVAHGGGD